LEKRGLTAQLAAQQVSGTSVIVWGDEMRYGLLGQVRRVWASRGYKPISRIQLVYQWGYLALAVDGRAGKLYWGGQANMKKESCASLSNCSPKKAMRPAISASKTRTTLINQVWHPNFLEGGILLAIRTAFFGSHLPC
jgi:hypothetical protein